MYGALIIILYREMGESTPPEGNFRITDANETRITDDDDNRITDEG